MALRRVLLPAPLPLVRPASPHDAEALARVLGLLGHAGSADEVRARLWASPPWRAVFVAELELEVVGAAVIEAAHPLHRAGREAALTALAVDPDCRHRGVGRALAATAVAWARRERCHGLQVRVSLLHDDAHGFFRAIGFEETHRTFDWSLG
jgi:GNAT superfamily N-acetyltransferase